MLYRLSYGDKVYPNVNYANFSSLRKMLSHYFLQTLLQSLDPTPDGFLITLDRAAASQKLDNEEGTLGRM